jgi:hypothetical protein
LLCLLTLIKVERQMNSSGTSWRKSCFNYIIYITETSFATELKLPGMLWINVTLFDITKNYVQYFRWLR